jgi:formate dehydrogenase iron-sulfur subunit
VVRSAMLDKLVRGLETKTPPPAKAETGFYTDTTVCIGCKACEVACKQWNQLPADGFEWTGNSHDNTAALSATSWRHVKFIEQFPEGGDGRWLMMSDVCKHCVDAPCHEACPTGAIVYNETGNVYIQQDICNGCAYCVAACPFGVITRAAFDGHAHKCTLCYDRQKDGMVPACAKACPTASIQFGPIAELRERATTRVETLHAKGVTSAYLYGDRETDTYSELNSFYLLLDKPSIYGLPDKPVHPWIHMKGDYVRAVSSGLVAILVTVLLFVALNR